MSNKIHCPRFPCASICTHASRDFRHNGLRVNQYLCAINRGVASGQNFLPPCFRNAFCNCGDVVYFLVKCSLSMSYAKPYIILGKTAKFLNISHFYTHLSLKKLVFRESGRSRQVPGGLTRRERAGGGLELTAGLPGLVSCEVVSIHYNLLRPGLICAVLYYIRVN